MYNGVGVRFADIAPFFLKYPMHMNYFGLAETKLIHFHRMFKTGGGGKGFKPPPPPPLNPLLVRHYDKYQTPTCLLQS